MARHPRKEETAPERPQPPTGWRPGRPLPAEVRRIFEAAGVRDLRDLAHRAGLAHSTLRQLRCNDEVSEATRAKLAAILRVSVEGLNVVFPRRKRAA